MLSSDCSRSSTMIQTTVHQSLFGHMKHWTRVLVTWHATSRPTEMLWLVLIMTSTTQLLVLRVTVRHSTGPCTQSFSSWS